MLRKVEARNRHYNDFEWLQTYWLFSFSDYYDPDNIQYGALRVYNDDVVQPKTGFPTHPHREMEIVTLVHSGEITHKDSMGNSGVIKAGDVQRMSAGNGLTHSEYNLADEPVHFNQIWIYPDESGLEPTYDQRSFAGVDRHNKLLPVASGQNIPNVVTFHTDATIYMSELDKGHELDFFTDDTRRIFIYLTDGNLLINGEQFSKSDQARIELEDKIKITAESDAVFTLIDVPSCKGWGYSKETLKGGKA
jgi:quercetin 2,3-dioxygenase